MNSSQTGHGVLLTDRENACDVRVGPEPADVTPPRRFPTAIRVLLGVVIMLVAAIAPLPVALLLRGVGVSTNALPPGLQVLTHIALTLCSTLTALGLVALAMRFVDRRPMAHTGFRLNRRSVPALLLGVVAAVVTTFAVGWPLAAAGLTRPDDSLGYDGSVPLWVVIVPALANAFIMQGFPEELVWRGYVFQTLQTRPATTVWISAAVFGVLHLVSGGGQEGGVERLLYLAGPFGFAVLAGALVLTTGSLWAAVGVHGGVHVATLLAQLWFHIGDGPALWIAVGLLHTVIGAVLMYRGRGAHTRRVDQATATSDVGRP